MTAADAASLTDDDRRWLASCTIGRKPIMDWLADDPPADSVRAQLIKVLDRYRSGPLNIIARVLADHLGTDPVRLYASCASAKLAEQARARGPSARRALHVAVALRTAGRSSTRCRSTAASGRTAGRGSTRSGSGP